MTLKQVTRTLTTAADGSESEVVLNHAFCKLLRVQCTAGTISTGADISITDGDSQNAVAIDHPGVAFDLDLTTKTDSDGSAYFDIYRTMLEGPITVTVANGGNAKTCDITLFFEF